MTTTREIVGIEINDVLLEYLKDSNYVYLRYTVNTEWFKLQEDPEPNKHSNAFYSLSTGRIRTNSNITHNINDFTVTNSISSNLYKEKLTEIRRLTSDIGKLKAASEQLPNVRDDPAFKALAAKRDLAATERNKLKQKVEDLSRRADEPESGPNYAELVQKLKEESDSAD
ncbi:hypothetical protein Ptr902_11106 [Pyrenophora tritici-repentis]|nr:hypothetical protein Ptr902_11106 [Pyrenophora tritici-repentis]